MIVFNDFVKTNISKITNIWTILFYLIIEEIKHYNPLITILFSLLSLFIFHYISLLTEEKNAIESELILLKEKLVADVATDGIKEEKTDKDVDVVKE